jgi:excisionase family DNA binding protein
MKTDLDHRTPTVHEPSDEVFTDAPIAGLLHTDHPAPPAGALEEFADEVLNVDHAAEFLRVDRKSLYAAINRGEVPHVRVGRLIRLSKVALLAWFRCGMTAGGVR